MDALAGHELQHKVGVPRAAQAVAQPEVRIKGLPHATSTNQQRDGGGDNSGEQVFPRIGARGVWRVVGWWVEWGGGLDLEVGEDDGRRAAGRTRRIEQGQLREEVRGALVHVNRRQLRFARLRQKRETRVSEWEQIEE